MPVVLSVKLPELREAVVIKKRQAKARPARKGVPLKAQLGRVVEGPPRLVLVLEVVGPVAPAGRAQQEKRGGVDLHPREKKDLAFAAVEIIPPNPGPAPRVEPYVR